MGAVVEKQFFVYCRESSVRKPLHKMGILLDNRLVELMVYPPTIFMGMAIHILSSKRRDPPAKSELKKAFSAKCAA